MARNKDTQDIAAEDVAVLELDEVTEDDESEETEETEARQPVTPSDIALSTGADPKAIRGWLRANFPRSKEMKGKSWDISDQAAAAVIEHFAPSEDEEDEVIGVDELEGNELEVVESD